MDGARFTDDRDQVAFLAQLMDERAGGNLRGTSGRGSPRGLGSLRMIGEERHTGWKVGGDQETGRDSVVGFAI